MIKKFCPQNENDRVENEFLNFKAGNMTYRQYTSRYNELAQLVPHSVKTEERLIKYYVKGLPQRVRVHAPKREWENPSKGTGKGNVTAEAKKPRSDEYETCSKCGKQHHVLGLWRLWTFEKELQENRIDWFRKRKGTGTAKGSGLSFNGGRSQREP
ncbi:hypothetical protein L1987_24176 [Smallanthus sonchifolius]|uniref:Uncharacterized protein n=1 Tax=Smallanthus sonchifolius TaxID=185202 RepID=A0ACB9IKL8_9ASTR|nr:hypothetical protein L1987_24176 [Smallanthus sonchifolius]